MKALTKWEHAKVVWIWPPSVYLKSHKFYGVCAKLIAVLKTTSRLKHFFPGKIIIITTLILALTILGILWLHLYLDSLFPWCAIIISSTCRIQVVREQDRMGGGAAGWRTHLRTKCWYRVLLSGIVDFQDLQAALEVIPVGVEGTEAKRSTVRQTRYSEKEEIFLPYPGQRTRTELVVEGLGTGQRQE